MKNSIVPAVRAALEAHHPAGVEIVYRIADAMSAGQKEQHEIRNMLTREEFDRVSNGLSRVKMKVGPNAEFEGYSLGVIELLWEGFEPQR